MFPQVGASSEVDHVNSWVKVMMKYNYTMTYNTKFERDMSRPFIMCVK